MLFCFDQECSMFCNYNVLRKWIKQILAIGHVGMGDGNSRVEVIEKYVDLCEEKTWMEGLGVLCGGRLWTEIEEWW